MKPTLFPVAVAPQQLLADLLCTYVSMRADRHFALCRDLATGAFQQRGAEAMEMFGRSSRELSVRAALTPKADDTTTEQPVAEKIVYPWEEPIYTVTNGIAVLQVTGALVKGYDAFTCWWYGVMSTDRLIEALDEIAARNDILALVTKFNTPGGMSTGMPEAADRIVALGERMITIAYTSDMACSNGQRLAVAHNFFLPTRSAIVGSIGTYLALYDYVENLKEWGIKLELFRDGRLKGIGLMGKALTKEERAFLDEDVQANGAIFKDFVRARRGNISDDDMQGQWFTGEQAVAKSLADATVTGFPEVMQKAQGALAGLLAGTAI
jgi:ClpP class serine protease